jgi:pimeloyl-ACP methyl ester carboxylesterase
MWCAIAFAETFDLTISGTPYGAETFRRVESPEGISLTGSVSLTLPGAGTAVLKQETTLGRDGHPLSYALDVDAPGQQAALKALLTQNGYTLSVTPKGATAESRDVPTKGPVFLLDNNFASHFDALTRALSSLGPGEERSITVLVPQVLQAIPASVRRGEDGKAVLSGVAVATRSYRLVVANLGTELVARTSDGALLSAEVPMQHALLARRGFETRPSPAPVAAAATGGGGRDADPRETAIELASPAGALPGALLVPRSETLVPAVVFLSGSGPNDKDETIGPNKPLADLARGLGDRGIASLRFDKRTYAVKDKSKFAAALLADEYYEDAKIAITRLAATKGIDPARIFVVGHSEGAMVAPKVAAASPETRGIVMMAPAVRPIDAVLIAQVEFGAKLTGLGADDIAEQTQALKDKFAAIRDPSRKDTPPFMGASAAYWRELIALDVPELVRGAKVPILVLQGDEDVQVRKDADFELLRTRVGETGRRVSYRSFAGLNHLFMKVEHGSTGAEYGFPGHVDPAVTAAIADWIFLR